MVTRRDYTAEAVKAAKSVLIELMHLLGEYRDNIVLIGGWVPEFLIPQETRPHVGSMDIDLALNHLKIQEEGYKRKKNSPSSFFAMCLLVIRSLKWKLIFYQANMRVPARGTAPRPSRE
jgi:hypothetical protein